ncbi:phenylalanine--tRNA ligase beta subunit-related protein [Pseudomonas aeruginosa]|nr:phenylalanine--tRNA ligase beta subunit-related protein [Pseudomonas aeruginosa]
MIRSVDLSRPTPLWMVERLRRSDIRSIDPVVDVTNYVMIELGQPDGMPSTLPRSTAARVRMAEDGEKLVLLDGQEITLRTDTLVIADHQRALAIAGGDGRRHSGVSDSTRDLFLEAAFFDTIALAGKAWPWRPHTVSHRFERGVAQPVGAQGHGARDARLILDIVGGEPGRSSSRSAKPHLPKVAPITLRAERVTLMLGMPLDAAEDRAPAASPELTVVADGEGQWSVGVPSHRSTFPPEVDLIGGTGPVSRLQPPAGALPAGAPGAEQQAGSARRAPLLRRLLVARGYQGSDHLQLHRSGPVRAVRSGHPAADLVARSPPTWRRCIPASGRAWSRRCGTTSTASSRGSACSKVACASSVNWKA